MASILENHFAKAVNSQTFYLGWEVHTRRNSARNKQHPDGKNLEDPLYKRGGRTSLFWPSPEAYMCKSGSRGE